MSERAKRCRRSRAEVNEILDAYRASGLSQRAFAASRKVSLSSLGYWLRKSRETSKTSLTSAKPSRLVPVRVMEKPAPPSSPAFEILTKGRIVRVPAEFESEALERLLSVVDAAC